MYAVTTQSAITNKALCQAQTCLPKITTNILTVDITIDHLHLAIITKFIWTQGHIFFSKAH